MRALPREMLGACQLDDRMPPTPSSVYVAMAGRDRPGEGGLPLADLARDGLVDNSVLTAELEVFSETLRRLEVDETTGPQRAAADRRRREAATA